MAEEAEIEYQFSTFTFRNDDYRFFSQQALIVSVDGRQYVCDYYTTLHELSERDLLSSPWNFIERDRYITEMEGSLNARFESEFSGILI